MRIFVLECKKVPSSEKFTLPRGPRGEKIVSLMNNDGQCKICKKQFPVESMVRDCEAKHENET
jgi:hypothetical protein